MEIPAQAIKTLMEIGVAGTNSGLFKQALAVFEGIDAVRPNSAEACIGVAVVHLYRNETEEAVAALRGEALQKSPKSIEVKMLLGVALKMAGRNAECESVIKELIASGDARAISTAESLKAR
jgi:Flp pilus assembly protein TadD